MINQPPCRFAIARGRVHRPADGRRFVPRPHGGDEADERFGQLCRIRGPVKIAVCDRLEQEKG
jgi:hypothetical protein